jgi:hypothetical protein
LRSLHLEWNNFTSIGVKALLTCVFNSSSLNALAESNHSLESMIILYGQISFVISSSSNLEGCIDRLLELDRTEKILLALQDKDSLLQYLANVPVELIPEVLAFTLRSPGCYQNQHKYLNVLYSSMRWWNMPLLYSYHHCCTTSNTKRKRNH